MIRIKDPKKITLANREKKDDIRIFLDLDGVITNFTKAACETCGIDMDDPEVKKKLKEDDNIEQFIDDEEMWKKINAEGIDWWINLELYPWSKKLYREIRKVTSMFCFLTAPSRNPYSVSGKVHWMTNHFGTRKYLLGADKYFCAGPHTLLIDDHKDKVEKFEEFGGKAFLWPNSNKLLDGDLDVEDTFCDLFEIIRIIS